MSHVGFIWFLNLFNFLKTFFFLLVRKIMTNIAKNLAILLTFFSILKFSINLNSTKNQLIILNNLIICSGHICFFRHNA